MDTRVASLLSAMHLSTGACSARGVSSTSGVAVEEPGQSTVERGCGTRQPSVSSRPRISTSAATPSCPAQSLISQSTVPWPTELPGSAARLGDRAVLVRGDGVLHLHRLEHDDQVARGDRVAVAHRDLDDRALHRCRHRVAGGLRRALPAGACAWPPVAGAGPLPPRARSPGSDTSSRRPPTSTTTDCRGASSVGLDGPGERRDRVVPLGLDPPGVHGELVRREGRVVDDEPVERQHGRHALDLELGQRPAGPLQRLRRGPTPVTISLASSESNCPPITDPASTPASTRTPGPDGNVIAETVPGAGRNPRPASSPLIRNSMECPRGSGSSRRFSASPSAMRNCSRTRSRPGGLLRHRVLDLQPGVDLQERDQPVLPDEELDGAGAVVAGLPADRLRRLVDRGAAARRTGTGRAPPRRASGSDAAASSRGCRRRSRCRACRPAPAPRRAGACRGSARRSTRRGRTPPSPRGPPSRTARRSPGARGRPSSRGRRRRTPP